MAIEHETSTVKENATREHLLERGYTQVYTGNGKGKTTAALGLALRATGAGLRTYIGQFMKGRDYSELHACSTLCPQVTMEQFGGPGFCKPGEQDSEEMQRASEGLGKLRRSMLSGEYHVIIADEINTAAAFSLLPESEILQLIHDKPRNVELVLTGRYASTSVRDAADLVTIMNDEKHYYNCGVLARKGIEC